MKNSLALLILFSLLSACNAKYQSNISYIGVIPKEQNVLRNIAFDLANYIAMEYAPGHTSFNLIAPKDEQIKVDDTFIDTFSVILENSLRQKGFEISKKGVELSFTLDSLDKGFYTQIRFGNGNNFSTVYNEEGKNISSRSSLLGDEHE